MPLFLSRPPNFTLLYGLLIFIVGYFAFLYRLDALPLHVWDEARNAVNALEMLDNGNFFITYFDGEVDFWNTKPPLLIWLMSISIHFFGPTELAVRLPSALSGFITTIVIFVFFGRYLKNYLAGFFSAMLLMSTLGFIGFHGAKTGDYDALLSLFTTSYILLFFRYCHSGSGRPAALLFCCLFALVAVATKSIQAVLFGPALFLYALFHKDRVNLLLSKTMVAAIFVFVAVLIVSFIWLYNYDENLFRSTIDNNIFNRFLANDRIKSNTESLFYFRWLVGETMVWVSILPILVVLIFHGSISSKTEQSLACYLLFCSAIYLLIIETASRKLPWYALPVYPLLSMLGGLGIEKLIRLVQLKIRVNVYLFLAIILFFSFSCIGYICHLIQYQENNYKQVNENNYGFIIHRLKQERPDIKVVHIVQDGFINKELELDFYNAPTLFYAKAFGRSGYQITFSTVLNERSAPGAVLLFCGQPIGSALNAKYQLTMVVSLPPCKVAIVDDII